MDASYKIQRGIHVHLIQFFMCPEFWVHIKTAIAFCVFYFDCLRNYQNQYRFLTATYAMRQATTRMPAPMKKVQLMLVKRRF